MRIPPSATARPRAALVAALGVSLAAATWLPQTAVHGHVDRSGGAGSSTVSASEGTVAARTESAAGSARATRRTSAAKRFGWGRPVAGDEFDYTGAPDPTKWAVYDSPGHGGTGLRSPRAWTVNGRVAKVVGDSQGTTGGMSAHFGHRRRGGWEVRMKTNRRDPKYHPVLLLWPEADNWPCGGEVDYAEGGGSWREVWFFLHHSCDNSQTYGTRKVNMTKWHNYAVKWTRHGITGYVDGVRWFHDPDRTHQPPGPMVQTVQLDWFPDGSATKRSWMKIDWVRVYNVHGR